MKDYIKKLFKEANKSLHNTILGWLKDPDYRAQLYVEDYIDQIIRELKNRDLTYKDFSDMANVSKAAITQLLDADESISIKRMFKYADVLNLTIEHPKLVSKDFEYFYEEYVRSEIENDFVEFIDIQQGQKDTTKTEKLKDFDFSEEQGEKELGTNYSYQNFYEENKAI